MRLGSFGLRVDTLPFAWFENTAFEGPDVFALFFWGGVLKSKSGENCNSLAHSWTFLILELPLFAALPVRSPRDALLVSGSWDPRYGLRADGPTNSESGASSLANSVRLEP